MALNRREFLLFTAGGALVEEAISAPAIQTQQHLQFKAIAFDAFAIFDPRPVAKLAESSFPGKGAELMNVWRTRQFEYQWLRALSGHYLDFLKATEDSLAFASKQLHLDIPPDKRQELLSAYSDLKVWPDAPAAVAALRKAGLRLVFLSNMTHSMLDRGIKQSGLDGIFENVLSTDRIRTYKPDPRAYQLAVDALKLKREAILFIAYAGWDVAGSKWFGYPTYWVNRLDSPMEELGTAPDGAGPDLDALVKYVIRNPDVHLGKQRSWSMG